MTIDNTILMSHNHKSNRKKKLLVRLQGPRQKSKTIV